MYSSVTFGCIITTIFFISIVVSVLIDPFGDGCEFLKVELNDGVGEKLGVLLRVPLRHVHHVGLQHGGAAPAAVAAAEAVDGGDGAVVPQAVLAANDAEARDAAAVVEDVEALGAGGRRQAGDDVDVARVAHRHPEPLAHGAALDEVLVGVRLVELANHGPHRVRRRVDSLRQQGGALARVDSVGVELNRPRPQLLELVRVQSGRNRQVMGRLRPDFSIFSSLQITVHRALSFLH